MGAYLSWLLQRPRGSLLNWWSHVVLKLMNGRTKPDVATVHARLQHEREQQPARPQALLLRALYDVEFEKQRHWFGHTERTYYVVRPRGLPRSNVTILYLHGGAYT